MAEIKDDPFKTTQATEESSTVKKAAAKKTTPVEDTRPVQDAGPAEDDLASFFAEMTMDEEDFKAPAPYVDRYIRPAKHLWVPVRIVEAKVEPRDMRAVVSYTDKGEMITNPRGIDKLVSMGKEQVIEEVSLYQFVVEAEHVTTHFGQRAFPYRLYAQAFPVRIPLKQPKMRNGVEELGFDKNSGKRLLAATHVVKVDQKVTEDEDVLKELADAMMADEGKIVMAQIRHRVKKNDDAIPRKNADGTFVKARTDDNGSFVYVTKGDGGSFYYAENDTEYDGDSSRLIPYGDNRYVIPDSSDDAAMVKDIVKRENIYDNLSEDVAPVPDRNVTVLRNDGSEAEAEVTWETVGNIVVAPVKAGTVVQAVAEGGELLTATWLGTHWQETKEPHELKVTELGEIQITPVSQATGEVSKSALDVFKG